MACPGIGDTKTIGSCVTHFDNLPNCTGEWSNDGWDACGFMNAGKLRRCKKTRCLGNTQACCVYGQSTSGSCPSAYTTSRYTSSACTPHWQDFCFDNMDRTNCKEWAKRNPDKARAQMAEYCADRLNDDDVNAIFCKQWCLDNPGDCAQTLSIFCRDSENMTHPLCRDYCMETHNCDRAMTKYCANNPLDPICTCILSPAKKYGSQYSPLCVDAKCQRTGYATKPMITARGAACPEITDCSMVFDLSAGGNIEFSDNVVSQNCGQPEIPPGNTPPWEESPEQEPPPNIEERLKSMNRGTIIFIIFVVVVFIAVAIGLITWGILRRGRRKKGQ